MTITSIGYDGDVDERQWALLSAYLGAVPCVGDPASLAVTAVAGADRTVRVAAGTGYAFGVTATSDAPVDVQLPPIASGSRWDAIVVRRNWQPAQGTTALISVQGTATQQDPAGLNNNPGVIHDQVIALVQVKAGIQGPTGIIDRRNVLSRLATALDGTPRLMVGSDSRTLQISLGASTGAWGGGVAGGEFGGWGGTGSSGAQGTPFFSVTNKWCHAWGAWDFKGYPLNDGYSRNLAIGLPVGPALNGNIDPASAGAPVIGTWRGSWNSNYGGKAWGLLVYSYLFSPTAFLIDSRGRFGRDDPNPTDTYRAPSAGDYLSVNLSYPV